MNKYLILFFILISHLSYACGKSSDTPNIENNPELPTTPGTQLKVMTYNIHHGNPPSRPNVIDLETIANTIKKANADIVAIQELDSATNRSNQEFQLARLASLCGMNYFFAKTIPYESGGYGIGILSKLPISETRNIPLPEDIQYTQYENRALAVAKITIKGKPSFYFICTHLDVNKDENRIVQAEKIVDYANSLKAPVILAGDLNTTAQATSFKVLSNFFVQASIKMEPTIPTNNPNRKIDHILFSGNKDFTLIKEEVLSKENYGSDHLPFVATLKVNF